MHYFTLCNHTLYHTYRFRSNSMGINKPKNFSNPFQLYSNHHHRYLLQQTFTHIFPNHHGTLYCIYCTFPLCNYWNVSHVAMFLMALINLPFFLSFLLYWKMIEWLTYKTSPQISSEISAKLAISCELSRPSVPLGCSKQSTIVPTTC